MGEVCSLLCGRPLGDMTPGVGPAVAGPGGVMMAALPPNTHMQSGLAYGPTGAMAPAAPVAVTTGGGLQACFKCEGKGFCHESSMDHDKGPNEKCFFCKTCDGCNGSGGIPGAPQTTYMQGGMVYGPGGMIMPAAPVAVTTGGGLQPCFKCEGKGFCHESSMDHDKGPNEKCFFCKTCDGCNGSGAIPGAPQTTYMQGGMVYGPGGMMMQAAPVAVTIGGGLQECFKCEGKGFCHESSMNHDKGPNEKCFFCSECKSCDGSGAVQAASPPIFRGGL